MNCKIWLDFVALQFESLHFHFKLTIHLTRFFYRCVASRLSKLSKCVASYYRLLKLAESIETLPTKIRINFHLPDIFKITTRNSFQMQHLLKTIDAKTDFKNSDFTEKNGQSLRPWGKSFSNSF